jgi:acyl-CoA thioesterase-1
MPFFSINFKSAPTRRIRPLILLGALLALALGAGSHSGCRSASDDPAPASPTPSAPASIAASPLPTPGVEERVGPLIVAFGDSLTAGYGLNENRSYPALLQRRLDALGYSYKVINAGVSGDTSAGGVRRIDWALKGDVRILILELGANDALRGQPVAEMKRNLARIIERAQSRGVKVILAGMEAPPNFGSEYTRDFRQAFRDLAEKYDLPLIPFFLAGVGGIAELNQGDAIHPNERGTEIVLDNVWKALEPLLAKS